MRIFVDSDACPAAITNILIKAAKRTNLDIFFIANKSLNLPPSPKIHKIRVTSGFNVADDKIIEMADNGDLVITADVPLADAVVAKGCLALNPRGWLYTEENIKQQLSLRNAMHDLRSTGIQTGGPKPLHARDLQAFANHLDRILTKIKN